MSLLQDPGVAGFDLVGRTRELTLITAAVAAGRDLLLEGPPGVSKSTLLRAVAHAYDAPFVLVEGNAELTPSRLLGYHDPAGVLRSGYVDDNFVAGPLVSAMRDGAFLYIEELNRAPEDTLNILLAAMAEREVVVPRLGTVAAAQGFRLLASMNPFDSIGTSRISDSVYDRWCRLVVDYQTEEEERGIVARRVPAAAPELVADAVALTRATRTHRSLRRGSSVRGAIDLAALADELSRVGSTIDRELVVLDAALLALSARIAVDDLSDETVEDVITGIWEMHFLGRPGA